MAFRNKLRSLTATTLHHHHHRYRQLSTSILNPDSTTPLSSKEKSRAALSLLRTETNPERVLEICRAASLHPDSHLDRIAFSKAIKKLKDSTHYDTIRVLLEECKARPDMQTERFVSHFIVLYGQGGLLQNAIQTFDELDKMGIERTAKTLNSLLHACILASDYDEMKRIFMDYPKKYGIRPDLDTYNEVIKGFCESGSSSSVYSILAEMDRRGIKPNGTTFASMIAGFYEEQKFEDVGKVLELMKKHDMKPGISIYNVRIQGLCKLSRSREAKALFDGIVARRMKPNSVTYNHLIRGFCKEGDYEEAKKLFEEMGKRGLNPEGECYFTLVYYLCLGKDFEAALKICKQCMEKGWVPNFSTMKMLVDGLVSISKVDEAREVIGQLKEKFARSADKWSEVEEGLPK